MMVIIGIGMFTCSACYVGRQGNLCIKILHKIEYKVVVHFVQAQGFFKQINTNNNKCNHVSSG